MLAHGMDDKIRYHEPRIYIEISRNLQYSGTNIYDPNYISYVGNINSTAIQSYFHQNNIEIDYQMNFRERFIPINDFKEFKKPKNLLEYCELIISCNHFYCLASGGATLALALGVKPTVFWGSGQNKMFHHSKLANYIQISSV